MKKPFVSVIAVTALFTSGLSAAQPAPKGGRDYISVVGSSTVYPLVAVVAERFGKAGKFKTPKVEATGTGGGIKLFCAGMDIKTPDMVNASRRIKVSELEACASNGVKDVVEVKIGFDGLTLGRAKAAPPMKLAREQLYLALAKAVPDPKGTEKLVKNPYNTWKDINKSLPDTKIEVIGPPPTSGTRDSFVELVMEYSCRQYAWLESLEKANKGEFKASCGSIREDGFYVEAGENDNLIVQKLVVNKGALGIFGFSFQEQNADKVQAVAIDNALPTFETISSGEYKLSRPLYVYVKKGHIDSVPGLREFTMALASDAVTGPDGYLVDKGLITLDEKDRVQLKSNVKQLKALAL